jgi:DNA processing protein
MFAGIGGVSSDLETAAVLALVRRGDRLWHHYASLIDMAGSAVAVLHGDFEEPGDPQFRLFESVEPPPDLDSIVAEIRQWREEGISVISILDDEYPSNLRSIHNRPPFLFVCGQILARDQQSVAVVGTRSASPAGLKASSEFASDLAKSGYTVVSGLALGVDTAAHTATLDVGGRTIAVIGTGLRRAYPAKNAALQRRLSEETAVVSQFWPDAPPTRTSFPMRNIVMSGVALATVVVEAAGESGARMQARFALEHGRPVFLLESLLEHEWARQYAARPGTHVVSSPAEVKEKIERLTRLEDLPLTG